MSMTTCNICGGEYNANRLDEHCCSCVALERQVAALTKERDELREEIHERSNKAMRMLGEVTKERDYWRGTFHLVEKDGMRGLAEQLAAAQAVNEKLRGVMQHSHDYGYVREVQAEALALPSDDTALQARLAEERERCAKLCDDFQKTSYLTIARHLAATIRNMK